MVDIHHHVHMEAIRQLVKIVSLLLTCESWGSNQGIRLGRKHLYPLNHLTCTSTMFSKRKVNRVQSFSGVIRTMAWVPDIRYAAESGMVMAVL